MSISQALDDVVHPSVMGIRNQADVLLQQLLQNSYTAAAPLEPNLKASELGEPAL